IDSAAPTTARATARRVQPNYRTPNTEHRTPPSTPALPPPPPRPPIAPNDYHAHIAPFVARPIPHPRGPQMRVYRTSAGTVAEVDGDHFALERVAWTGLLTAADPAGVIRRAVEALPPGSERAQPTREELLAPVDRQEVWAAGVTYLRSRTARMEESKTAGGGSFYDRVYEAERPELFFKASPARVVSPGRDVRIRADSKWNVPEPEFALVINPQRRIVGYTIGNDMSSRDIEGE